MGAHTCQKEDIDLYVQVNMGCFSVADAHVRPALRDAEVVHTVSQSATLGSGMLLLASFIAALKHEGF